MIRYQNKIKKFINEHEELSEKFAEVTGSYLDSYEEELVIAYISIKNDLPYLSTEEILETGINNSIKNGGNIFDGFKLIVESNEDYELNSVQQYFKEVNDIYEKNDNNYDIEYCEENRDKLIEMNLKTVISIAKKYQGLGLSLNELISAGNLGLVIAYDKFDPSRSKLKDNILNTLDSLDDEFDYNKLSNAISQYMTYGDIKKKFDDKFKPGEIYKKAYVIKWINSNIYNAKFNSIATMWIRAYILIEIDNNSRIIKKPKSEIYRDKEKYGAYKKEIMFDIDAPVNDDTDTCLGDILYIEDESKSDLDISEAYDTFKEGLNKLLEGVKYRDRSIFLKKFGIGLPRPMLPKEIAEQEDLSIARVSQIFQSVIEQMQLNQAKYNINPNILFESVKKFQ